MHVGISNLIQSAYFEFVSLSLKVKTAINQMITHNCEVAAAAALPAQAQNQPEGERQRQPQPPRPPKRRKVDAGARYAQAGLCQNENEPITPLNEVEFYLKEPIGNDKDLLLWWQGKVSAVQISTFIS